MRAYEFEKPLTIQQTQDKSLKQQAKRIQIQQTQRRLQKQREKATATTAQLSKLQNKSP
jgi:hypothetical protein